MLYYLYPWLREFFFGFNVIRYITFRSVSAAVTSFIVCIVVGHYLIRKLGKSGLIEKQGKDDSPHLKSLHGKKEGTPTMGGIIIGIAVLSSCFLWADLSNRFVKLTLFGSSGCITNRFNTEVLVV